MSGKLDWFIPSWFVPGWLRAIWFRTSWWMMGWQTTGWPMTKCLHVTGALNYSAVVGGCRMFLFFLNLIRSLRYPSIKMRMGKIKECYLKKITDASDLLQLTLPAITAVDLAGFQVVIWPFPANRLVVRGRRKWPWESITASPPCTITASVMKSQCPYYVCECSPTWWGRGEAGAATPLYFLLPRA